jgi:dTDP-4-amino-4,6-dideoxygalactose transaminase
MAASQVGLKQPIVQHGTIPFVDLRRMHDMAAEELEAAFHRVVERGSFTLGEEVEGFEHEFADYVGTEHAIGVGSGTDALHLALRACGVGPDDEVVTAVNTFAATAEAIVMCGATPVFVDIDDATSLMDLDALERAITGRTRAVIPVHLYGQCVDMKRVLGIAQQHDLRVIEDACQAHGAVRDGLRAGAGGDAGCFSFYPSKNLGALGDGGCVVTSDGAVADRVRALRNHGEDRSRLHTESGYCTRLHGLQAAFLRAKLKRLDDWNLSRRMAAEWYDESLEGVSLARPTTVPGATHVFHLYVVRVGSRDAVRARLGELGIQSGVHYAVPLHLEPAFEELGYGRGDFPIAEQAATEILSLPMYPYMEEVEVEMVAVALREVAGV